MLTLPFTPSQLELTRDKSLFAGDKAPSATLHFPPTLGIVLRQKNREQEVEERELTPTINPLIKLDACHHTQALD